MLFVTFKHQSDFPLRGNDKFACTKLELKDSTPFYRPSRPIPITTNLKRYQHYKEPMFLHLLFSKF